MASISDESKCTVETKDGPICGFIDKTDEGSYYKFGKIPYAKPPVGRLRFLMFEGNNSALGSFDVIDGTYLVTLYDQKRVPRQKTMQNEWQMF